MGAEFVGRVSRAMLIALALVATCGGLLAGWPGAVGGLAGGLISLGSFRWIASGVARPSALQAGSGLALSALAARHVPCSGTSLAARGGARCAGGLPVIDLVTSRFRLGSAHRSCYNRMMRRESSSAPMSENELFLKLFITNGGGW